MLQLFKNIYRLCKILNKITIEDRGDIVLIKSKGSIGIETEEHLVLYSKTGQLVTSHAMTNFNPPVANKGIFVDNVSSVRNYLACMERENKIVQEETLKKALELTEKNQREIEEVHQLCKHEIKE